MVELIGWGSSLVLLLTLVRQVYTQWRTRATAGVSKWLFIGQVAASTGYVIYSSLLQLGIRQFECRDFGDGFGWRSDLFSKP